MKKSLLLSLFLGLCISLTGCPGGGNGGGGNGGNGGGGNTGGTTDTEEMVELDLSKAGVVKGTVKWEGDKPKRNRVLMTSDPYCGSAHPKPPMSPKLVIGDDGGVKNVFVYVSKGLKNYKYDKPSGDVELDQKGCLYEPHVFGIRTGQTLKITNSDKTAHNIHPTPKKNTEWNKGQKAGDDPLEESFKVMELGVPIGCDIHSWMLCYAHVMDHPYFAVTGADGSFELPKLPPGKYTITAWHENRKLEDQTQEVEVKENGEVSVEFTFGM